jgi:hypothetical protein
MENVRDYIYKKKLNLNLERLKEECWLTYGFIKDNYIDKNSDKNRQWSLGVVSFRYNLFRFGHPELNELQRNIKQMFLEINPEATEKHYIHCWLNLCDKHGFYPWHTHNYRYDFMADDKKYQIDKSEIHNRQTALLNGRHGFFCVDVEPSSTVYRFLDTNEIYELNDSDNLLIMGKNNNDEHRTYPWPYDRTRITIAYNIVSSKYVELPCRQSWMIL